MIIQHKGDVTKGLYFLAEEEEMVAEIVYAPGGEGLIIIEHTRVDDGLRGQNVGYELVHKVVDHARRNGLEIIPVCPFAKSVIEKRPDFQDVLSSKD